ncbi:MAG: OB-fold nucleic acid binding domain-containing protein, partial [Gemmatimonadaceae bacterium]
MTGPADPSATTLRTHCGGALRLADAGAAVTLGGWVHKARDLGGIVFLDLRDRDGLVQVSFNPDWTAPAVIAAAAVVGVESAIIVDGVVAPRPAEMRNADLATGEIEVRATALRVVGPAVAPA